MDHGRHIHLRQDEYFKVEQGTLGIIPDGVEHVLTDDDPFKDVDHIVDVNFLRNAVGYVAD